MILHSDWHNALPESARRLAEMRGEDGDAAYAKELAAMEERAALPRTDWPDDGGFVSAEERYADAHPMDDHAYDAEMDRYERSRGLR